MLVSSAPRDSYSPYPTLTNLRDRGLSQPDATSQKLALYYRALAAKYGLTLPGRPAGLTEGQAQAADILEGIEVAGAEMQALASRLFRMLAKGGAPCAQLLAYNRLAIGLYELQKEMIAELAKDGVQGIPLAPPWPPLFVGFGNHAAAPADSFWEINCDVPIVQLATDDNPDGVKVMLDKPCDTALSGAGLVVVGILVAGAIIYGVAKTIVTASVDKTRMREEAKKHVRNLDCMNDYAYLLEKRTQQCVDSGTGKSWEDCSYEAEQSLKDYDCEMAAETATIERKSEGGGGFPWLWVLGIVGVGLGGYMVYRRFKRKRGEKQQGAELIEYDED